MSRPPRISVIITTYNRADLLLEAIASVRAQTFDDYELIVADDGSTDDTAVRLPPLPALRYLQLKHSGRPEAVRNQALAVTRGDLIAFLDDDDLWEPDKLAAQVPLFDADSALGLVYSDARLLHPDGTLSDPVLRPHQKRPRRLFDHLLSDCFIHPSTVILRRRLFDQIGPFEDRFFSQGDYYFWLRALHTAPARPVPRPLVRVRQHAVGRLSIERNLRHYECTIEVLDHVRATLPLTPGQRLRSRLALARYHTHVGRALLAAGQTAPSSAPSTSDLGRRSEQAAARQSLRRALRLNPLRLGAWRSLGRALLAAHLRR